MRSTAAIIPLVFLTLGCSTVGTHKTILFTGAEPFVAARRFILEAHADPRLQNTHRSLEQIGSRLQIRFKRPHSTDTDVVAVSFRPDGTQTRILLDHSHIDSLGRRSTCEFTQHMETAIAEILGGGILDTEDELGTMSVSLAASY